MKERILALSAHLLGFTGSILLPGLGGAILVMLLMVFSDYRQKPLLTEHGKEIINLQINKMIAFVGVALTITALCQFVGKDYCTEVFALLAFTLIRYGLMTYVGLLTLEAIFVAIGAIKAVKGKLCWYPMPRRFIR